MSRWQPCPGPGASKHSRLGVKSLHKARIHSPGQNVSLIMDGKVGSERWLGPILDLPVPQPQPPVKQMVNNALIGMCDQSF